MVQNDNLCDDTSDSDFENVDKSKGKFISEIENPIPNFHGRDVDVGKCACKRGVKEKKQVGDKGKLWSSWMSTKKSFQIKSLYPDHKWCRNYNLGSLVTFKWVAHYYAREIINNPWISYKYMQNSIKEKFLINVSLGQCRRVKHMALFDHEGGLKDHYSRLWQYRQAVLDSNPGSTCHMDLEESIRVDGCFLTHTCKGELLTVMGRNANNKMFPIAWAVGLIDAVGVWHSKAESRQYTRHIYVNFKKKWCGLQFKKLFWSWVVYPSGFRIVKVKRYDESFGVNIHLKKCVSRMWELTGIPCVHVVAAYTHLKLEPKLGEVRCGNPQLIGSYLVGIGKEGLGILLRMKMRIGIDLPRSLPSNLGKLGLGKGSNAAVERSTPAADGSNAVVEASNERNKNKFQPLIPTVDEAPKYMEDLVLPALKSTLARKRRVNLLKKQFKKIQTLGKQEHLEHAGMMDQQALEETLRAEREEKAMVEEILRKQAKDEKAWEEYVSEFKEHELRDWDDRLEDAVGVMLFVNDEISEFKDSVQQDQGPCPILPVITILRTLNFYP
nr:hypothetical protein CTI12_AA105810 [Tanacetum cinerariifolium]